jgi:CPA2 family monovalent cation:H+ antiporter-2
MHEGFIRDLAIALSVAALVSIIAKRYKLPSVLAYLGAGLIIGPYIPIPLFADAERIKNLSELGVMLVMFNIGLEFRISRFIQVLPTAGITALFEISMMGLVGLMLGYLFGWPTEQAIFLGGALAISSTMIVSKVFEDNRPSKEVKEHVLGILVIQDIVAILLITILGTFAVTKQIEFSSILPTVMKLLSVLIFSIVAGIFIIPKLIRYVSRQGNTEVLTIVAIGICFGSAMLIESLGYSIALGAFISGVLVSESGESHKVERVIRPLKDVFAAIFFVSVGMSVDPMIAYNVLPYSLVVTAAVVFFQFHTVLLGGILSGTGTTKSLQSGLALGQIGEFAFIITSIGIVGGIVDDKFQAIVVSVAVLSSLSTPLLWQRSELIIAKILKLMPNRIRITIGLYEAWFDRLRSNPTEQEEQRAFGIPKKIILPLLLDIALLLIIPPSILKFLPEILETFAPENLIKFNSVIVVLTLAAITTPILYGFVKATSQLVNFLSKKIFIEKQDSTFEMEAVQKLFSLMIWSILILLVGTLMLSLIRPFTNSTITLIALMIMFLFTMTLLWRRASDVSKDFESGGQALISVFKRQTFDTHKKTKTAKEIQIPGLENIDSMPVTNQNLIGKSLSQLSFRNVTGVTVVSIQRGENQILFPNQDETLQDGDILKIWGDSESKKKCKNVLSQ